MLRLAESLGTRNPLQPDPVVFGISLYSLEPTATNLDQAPILGGSHRPHNVAWSQSGNPSPLCGLVQMLCWKTPTK